MTDKTGWWRSAAIYQVYIRSFADGNGDGVGDLAGVRARLDHLADLGIDAIWFTPWYPSPMADGGYDVADYRDIDPLFGTLSEARAASADLYVARDLAALPPSRGLREARYSLVGIGAVRGDSPTYGRGRYWVVVIYAGP